MKDVLIQIKNAHKDRGGGIKQTLQEKKFGRTQKSHPSNLEFFTTPQKKIKDPIPWIFKIQMLLPDEGSCRF